MANWQDDPDLAAMRPRRGSTPWGRILVGILIVGCGTFGLAYYLPLNRAHHALTDDHARLRQKLEGIQQTLEKWYRRLRKSKPTTAVMPGAQPPEPSPLPQAPAAAPASENTSIFVKREASERLDKAAFIDNMETD